MFLNVFYTRLNTVLLIYINVNTWTMWNMNAFSKRTETTTYTSWKYEELNTRHIWHAVDSLMIKDLTLNTPLIWYTIIVMETFLIINEWFKRVTCKLFTFPWSNTALWKHKAANTKKQCKCNMINLNICSVFKPIELDLHF